MRHSLDDLGLHWLYLKQQQKKHLNERRIKKNKQKKKKIQVRKLNELMLHAKKC